MFQNPGLWLKVSAVVFCLSLGATLSFAILSLLARGAFKEKYDIRGADQLSVSFPMIALLSFFWIVPCALSFLGRIWGGQIVPGQLMFLLNLLCFAPFVILMLWVQVTTCDKTKRRPSVRRPIWFVLGSVFLCLMVLSLFDTALSESLRSSFADLLSRCGIYLKPALRKVFLFATLLPISMIFYSFWILFRRPVDVKKDDGSSKPKTKGLFRRFLDWLFGRHDAEEATAEESEPTPPEWVAGFLEKISLLEIDVETRESGKPDPLCVGETSDFDETGEGDELAFLMTGEVERNDTKSSDDNVDEGKSIEDSKTENTARFWPTKAQASFYKRFREVYETALEKAASGAYVSPDMILAGDEGSGRSELLRACAIYAAFARGQHVLYVVSDLRQADLVLKKMKDTIEKMMLSCYLTCDILDAQKVIKWMAGVMIAGKDDLKGEPIPTILVATPRAIEDCLFDNDRATDQNSYNQLRHVIQTFEVILIDDFMELDSTERSHMTFVVHKFQTLLAYKRVLPQIVVVTPRLLDGVGVAEVGDKLFGRTDFDLNNYLVLRPRSFQKGTAAWKIPLRVRDPNASPSDACNALVRICLDLGLDVVMFRKGITIQQCEEVRNDLVRGIEGGSLAVISRLDQLPSKTSPDAVFYLATLSGDTGVSLRLNFGGEDSVFIQVSAADAVSLEIQEIVPILPNASAVALRIHHLKSLLRFITPNEPLYESIWQFFGLSVDGEDIATVQRQDSLTPSVEWGVDSWNEPEAYGEPLESQISLSDQALASNAGVHIKFSSLPLLKDNIFRIKGENKLILGVASNGNDGVDDNESAPDALAEWVEGNRHLAGCDLSHAERLMLSRSDDGDFSGKPSENVLSIRRFAKGDATCCAKIEPQRWRGDGSDFDTPVRTLSWAIEPVVQPQIFINAENCTFMGFDLPESRGVPRFVEATIPRLLNGNGQMNNVSPPVTYRYPAYGSALVFLPRRFTPSEAEAQVQRFVADSWTTNDISSFSPVMTHLFTGVLRRIIPDFAFFAACPAFYIGKREKSIGELVIWLLEPTNSGKSLNHIVERFFGVANSKKDNPFDIPDLSGKPKHDINAARLVSAMIDVLRRVKAIANPDAKLRWLRAFSATAIETSLETEKDKTLFAEDIVRCETALSELLDRLTNGHVPSEADDASPLSCDSSWIVKRRDLDSSLLVESDEWEIGPILPQGFAIGAGARSCKWTARRTDHELDYGFADVASHQDYEQFLNRNWIDKWGSRISTSSIAEYGENDFYKEAIDELFTKLERDFAKSGKRRGQKNYNKELAEYLLCFVQGGMNYQKDPELPESDWPRFPSETLSMRGGDCEDTSILYMELLRRAHIDCAYLHVPGHAAVGVGVSVTTTQSGKTPVSYKWLGTRYIYAETAIGGGNYLGLGEETMLIPSASKIPAAVVPCPAASPSDSITVRILNVEWDGDDKAIRFAIASTKDWSEADKAVCLACFARPLKSVFDDPTGKEYPMVGAVKLPSLKTGEVVEGRLNIQVPDYSSFWLDVFICEIDTGIVRGHFIGAAHLTAGASH